MVRYCAVAPAASSKVPADWFSASAMDTKRAAEASAMEKAVSHGDVGISTPVASDGGASYIAGTPEGRNPYQPAAAAAAAAVRSKL